MPSVKTTYLLAPPQPQRCETDGLDARSAPFGAPEPTRDDEHVSVAVSPSFDQLVRPTWAEVDQAREHYETQARHLRWWQRWFVGMFAIYTTLVGILVLRLALGS